MASVACVYRVLICLPVLYFNKDILYAFLIEKMLIKYCILG